MFLFLIFPPLNTLHVYEFLSYWCLSSCLLLLRSYRELSLHFNYCTQDIFLLLLISGDIGPCSQSQYIRDNFHLNIRNNLISLATGFDILFYRNPFRSWYFFYIIMFSNFSQRQEQFCFVFGEGGGRRDTCIHIKHAQCTQAQWPRTRNRGGEGGILVYISNTLSVRRRNDLEPVNVECIWIEIRDPTCNFLLWCTYWPPNSDKSIWRNICWSIDKASDISNKFDKVGDLNEHSTHSPIQQKNKIIEPTSVTQSTTTLIDPIQVSVFDSGTFEGDQKVYACILSFSKQCDTSLQRAG